MTTQLSNLVSRYGHMAAILIAAAALPACTGYETDSEEWDEDVEEAEQEIGPAGGNNVNAAGSDQLKRPITNGAGITSPTNPDPIQLCAAGTVTSTGCTLSSQWESWVTADPTKRDSVLKGIAKCSVEPTFTITSPDGLRTFPGQWPLFPEWKTNRLAGQAKRERVSACILALVNGNDQSLTICLIGPGGAPFSDACTDPNISVREGGFYGDLFAGTPRAYVAGPDTAEVANTGRVCTSNNGTYCRAEGDTSAPQKIVLAGAIMGSPQQGYANKRCNALATSGGFEYCTEFFSTEEPGRVYTNVFTSFVPALP